MRIQADAWRSIEFSRAFRSDSISSSAWRFTRHLNFFHRNYLDSRKQRKQSSILSGRSGRTENRNSRWQAFNISNVGLEVSAHGELARARAYFNLCTDRVFFFCMLFFFCFGLCSRAEIRARLRDIYTGVVFWSNYYYCTCGYRSVGKRGGRRFSSLGGRDSRG